MKSEAEYISVSITTQEAVWLRRILTDLQALPEGPTIIMEDNQGTIAIGRNSIIHNRTKHIDMKYHYVQEALQERIITLRYYSINKMPADILTKGIPSGRFEKLCKGMGMDNTEL